MRSAEGPSWEGAFVNRPLFLLTAVPKAAVRVGAWGQLAFHFPVHAASHRQKLQCPVLLQQGFLKCSLIEDEKEQ